MAKECCEQDENNFVKAKSSTASVVASSDKSSDDQAHTADDGHDHGDAEVQGWRTHLPLLLSLAILIVMLTLEFGFDFIPQFPINLSVYGIAYLLAGYGVLDLAFRKAKRFGFF